MGTAIDVTVGEQTDIKLTVEGISIVVTVDDWTEINFAVSRGSVPCDETRTISRTDPAMLNAGDWQTSTSAAILNTISFDAGSSAKYLVMAVANPDGLSTTDAAAAGKPTGEPQLCRYGSGATYVTLAKVATYEMDPLVSEPHGWFSMYLYIGDDIPATGQFEITVACLIDETQITEAHAVGYAGTGIGTIARVDAAIEFRAVLKKSLDSGTYAGFGFAVGIWDEISLGGSPETWQVDPATTYMQLDSTDASPGESMKPYSARIAGPSDLTVVGARDVGWVTAVQGEAYYMLLTDSSNDCYQTGEVTWVVTVEHSTDIEVTVE